MGRQAKGVVSWGLVFALILTLSSPFLLAQDPGKGDLVGFVYGRDGSTPVTGAVIVVKNVTTGAMTESGVSDGLGVFTVPGLDPGIYAVGVKTGDGDFNSQEFFGVAPQQTSKISIALNPYDPVAATAAKEVVKEQRAKGEAYVGKVLKYDAAAKTAEIIVEIGLIQKEDRIHVKGQATDFYQDLTRLGASGSKTDRVVSGSTAVIATSRPCAEGDFVYVVCRRGMLPLFLAPLGVAAITAGAMPLAAQYREDISPHKIK